MLLIYSRLLILFTLCFSIIFAVDSDGDGYSDDLEIELGRVNLKVIPINIPERNNNSAGLSMASIQIKMIVR